MSMLSVGQRLTTDAGLTLSVGPLLGSGSQGEVYRASLQTGGEGALKWYFPQQATPEQRRRLERLTLSGRPSDRFLWPEAVVTELTRPGFGYLMPLRPPTYKTLVHLMTGKLSPSFHALCTAAIQLCDSFLRLHSKGLCYQDLSFGNLFFEPETGDILICDNDNVSVDGAEPSGVLGTARFMAPEVVRGEAYPSSATDRHSLAVLLFYLFLVHHPLDGAREASIRCMDLPAMNRLYGSEPIFIFDPHDLSNRPVPGIQDNPLIYWHHVLPKALKARFLEAFTVGLHRPEARVVESIWLKTLIRVRDSLRLCPHEAEPVECFHDPDALEARCWRCNALMPPPLVMTLPAGPVVMTPGRKLYPHHLGQPNDLSAPWAEVTCHPQNPRILGLKNLSPTPLTKRLPDGSQASVPPGARISLEPGARFDFGGVEAVIS